MQFSDNDFPFNRVLTLDYLIDFWRTLAADESSPQKAIARAIALEVDAVPELHGTIDDLGVLQNHKDILSRLMTAVFPIAHAGMGIVAAALVPYKMSSIYSTAGLDELGILDNFHQRTTVTGVPIDEEGFLRGKASGAYMEILKSYYGLEHTAVYPLVYTHIDEESGLRKFYQIIFDTQFARPVVKGKLPDLSTAQIEVLLSSPMNLELWMELLPPENFEFHGFVVLKALDVTAQEVHSALKKDLLQKDAFASEESIDRLESRLRTLLRLPRMRLGLISLPDDDFEEMPYARRIGRSLLLSNDVMPECPQRHNSAYKAVFESNEPIVLSDLQNCEYCTGFEHHLVEQNISSLMLAPLRYEGKLIGLMELASPRKGAVTKINAIQLMDVITLFATAMKRTMDEQEDRIQALMKHKYTAIHPSVEWKFRKSVFHHLARGDDTRPEETEVVFDGVYPLYGLSDIRNSSTNRSTAIQSDLIEQLSLALHVVVEASSHRPLPALDGIGYRIDRFVDAADRNPTTDIEITALDFLRTEVESLFEMLSSFGQSVQEKIKTYQQALDPKLGILYRRRKEYEESVAVINDTISHFLDRKQVAAQAMFPHYFEKYKTDGVDYNIYVGNSIAEKQQFDLLYLNNLRLWQLMTTCGIDWELGRTGELRVPLETAHLILVQNIPLSIRFREDEKKFDVDGAYNVRYEIVKKRIDKAEIRGTSERLTQPGHIAIVYSQSGEAAEYKRYLDYLTAAGYLDDGSLEELNLQDLQGASGLRALRVRIAETPPDAEVIVQPDRIHDVSEAPASDQAVA